ncbi:ComEA family DNA-binding protein [Arhodomonas sp. AD133]|uniref:ComEA family DNA-binding protein n=1 Tax=Arhodomonas sp. AD133 TaxID=3415009 RepID=UPI003EBF8799
MKRFHAAVIAACLAFAPMAFAAAVNVNKADATALEQLDGIGPVKAEAIVKYRKANGPFSQLADLTKVDGIGETTVESLRDDITLE